MRPNGEPSRIRTARLLERTREAVEKLDAHILCLQEIGGVPDLEFLAPGYDYYSESRLNPDAAPRSRKHGVGTAVRPGIGCVERLADIPLASALGADAYARDAVALNIETKSTCFTLVNLHLKAGCREKLRLDKRGACKILKAQIDLLCDWLRQQKSPCILVGDFNRVLAQPRDTVQKLLQGASNTDLKIAPTSYGQIDHFLLPSSWKCQKIERPVRDFRNYSDHEPRLIEIMPRSPT